MRRARPLLLFLCLALGLAAFAAPAGAEILPGMPVEKDTTMPYYIRVYLGNQMVVAYDSATNEPVRYMICSSGAGSTPTIRGTFKLPGSGAASWSAFGSVYVRYPTRIKGSYYFHSVLYYSRDTSSLNMTEWRKLGNRASHGCIRMTPLDAQWINYNCKKGTRVTIVNGKLEGLKAIHDQIESDLDKHGQSIVQPTLSPTPSPPPPVLNYGDRGSKVKALQRSLLSHGYYGKAANGVFSEATLAAWNEYQRVRGWAVNQTATTEQQQELANDQVNFGMNRNLTNGATGVVVQALETKLKALGFFSGTPDTRYNTVTVKAVKAYQKARGIAPANGKANTALQQTLFAEK